MKTTPPSRSAPPAQALWRMPILLGLLSGAGLLLALLAGEDWHGLAWLGVGAPLLAVAWCALRARRSDRA